jgi:hypothetical protein
MIDRKALWISGLIILAMTAAAFWRLSLPPDLTQVIVRSPAYPHAPRHTIQGLLGLFGLPLSLIFLTAVLYARKWFVSGPADALRPWQSWSAIMLIPFTVLLGLMQAIRIAQSLGVGIALDRQAIARTYIVATGGLLTVLGNALPKMPPLSVRSPFFRLGPWQETQQLRFMGRLIVAVGLADIVSGALLPIKLTGLLLAGLGLAGLIAGIWHRMKLKRGPTP